MDAAEMIESYAAAGLECFPVHSIRDGRCTCGRTVGNGPNDCHSPGKHPLLGLAHPKGDPLRDTCRGECGQLGHGLYDATCDAGQLAEWLARWPWCNWAARPPENTIVLDVDPRNNGIAALARIQAQNAMLPKTLTARTGGGGWHIWITYAGPVRGKLAEGIDLKSRKGYVVVPPSGHISGGTYAWTVQAPAAHAPAWLRPMLAPAQPRPFRVTGNGTSGIAPLVRFVTDSAEGERNRRLFWAACRAHERGIDPSLLVAAAVATGLPAHAAEATVRSAGRTTGRKAA